nr:membrane glycoprotein E51 [Elephant endotheliotropic herpesvirus 1B]
MGGGTSILTLYLGGIFFVFALCANQDFCQHDDQRSFETPTISILNDQITITVKIKIDGFSILRHNGSIIYTTSQETSNVNTNTTHFTFVTSCATATGRYMLQIAAHGHGTTCQYFNVTNCPPYFTPTHLAQSACSECRCAIFTITSFVILVFYLLF